ncbi:MAG: hypothetical protein Q9160_007413 [Pyrenula sp. 1 TL-2023]
MVTQIAPQGIIRGAVRIVHLSPETEAAAVSIRGTLPALVARERLALKFAPLNFGGRSRPQWVSNTPLTPLFMDIQKPSQTSAGNGPTSISGIDQRLFAFQGEDSRVTSNIYREPATIVGLASIRIEIGDEVWQFERTPLAVIARPSPWGYNLLGRAYLLKTLSTGCHTDKTTSRSQHPSKLKDDLILVKDANLHGLPTRVINTNFAGLIRLMTWVTYDV